MAQDGIPYSGFLYAGLMIDESGQPRTLEFNCRMGDPETQPIMARVKSDLATVFEKAIDGRLDEAEIVWDRRTALGVVMAAAGYPDEPRKGDPIEGLPPSGNPAEADTLVFHAGTVERDGRVFTSGGRVLCVTGLGDSVKIAQARAYQAIEAIRFDGMQFRRDIGHRAIARKR
jgi:phosphoribosylamine--glycine ligase